MKTSRRTASASASGSRRKAATWRAIGLRYREAIARPMAWRGIVAILFALYALSGTWESVRALALAFGAYAAFEALAALVAGVGLKNRPLVLIAIADTVTGTYFLLRPDLREHTLSYVLGAWAMATGVLELFAADALRRSPPTERRQAAAGIVSIVLGVGLAIYPELGHAELAGWLGATMMLFGCFCLLAAARVRFETEARGPQPKSWRRGAA